MLRKIVLPTSLSIFLLFFTLSLVQFPATAATKAGYAPSVVINVTSTSDSLFNDGLCSLREAIIAANTNTASGAAAGECPAGSTADTINLQTGTYTLGLAGGGTDTPQINDLDILSELSIVGSTSGFTFVDANGIDRAIEVSTTGKATISNLWILGGQDNGWAGGGLSNSGQLTMTNSVLLANTSTASGGGLYNGYGATATLRTISFGNNTASNGAGVHNSGTITLDRVSLDFGSAGSGGGLWNDGWATLKDVNISFNTAESLGGGIYNYSVITLTNVTINDNTSTNGNGGGMWSNGGFSLVNVTLSGNHADNGFGGGFFKALNSGSFTNVTIANNTAGLGGGLNAMVVGLTTRNTLVVNNPSGGNCRVDNGTVTSLGYNLSSDNTCDLAFNQTGDQINILAPKVGPLVDNGGTTETHALLHSSPAIDSGSNTGCPADDQRGFRRPLDGDNNGTATCDIGAYEYGLESYLPMVVR